MNRMTPNGATLQTMRGITAVALVALVVAPAYGQFVDAGSAPSGPRFGDARAQRFRVGMIVGATAGSLRDIYATMPVPGEWPEQQVRVV